jgi:diguanylate cyclase (GGDEF)-like protein
MDIDHFKAVNDRFGHAAGDAVLVHVAGLVQDMALPALAAVGRVGGEEFMLLLPDADERAAAGLAEALRDRLSADPVRFGDAPIPITASFGVATLRGGDAERMLVDADDALYAAKRAGRDRVVVQGGWGRLAASA